MPDYKFYFILATVCLCLSLGLAIVKGQLKYKTGRFFDSFKILVLGVALSGFFMFIPSCYNAYVLENENPIEMIPIAIHHMLRMFVVDGQYDFLINNLEIPDGTNWLLKGYSVLSSVIFVVAPVLTFGFVLSFVKNLSANIRFYLKFFSNVYVFSELNSESLSLAESLRKNKKRALLVFYDVFEKGEEDYELIEKARELGAICFQNDITNISFKFHYPNSEIYFFTIGKDQSENISQSLKLFEKFKNRKNTNLYVFSNQVEAEMLLINAFSNSTDDVKIKVRRVNDVQSLILRNLYDSGYDKIFKSAYSDGSDTKKINALVIGLGKHGTEMLKALPWFCQMDGFLAEINAFDLDTTAFSKFKSYCPELMEFSGKLSIDGESKYTINIHSGLDVNTSEFDNMILSLPRTTYVFIALGNDEINISTAVKVRSLLERKGYNPEIQTIVYNSDKRDALTNITLFNGKEYRVEFIGDIKSSYSEEVILHSKLESEALDRHLKWGKEIDFWRYNYNYKSSVASAIHAKMKKLCCIPGIEKTPAERTEDERLNIRVLEHMRWNAYMRSEGYVYAGTTDKSGRNDLAKTHNCLVPFDELPPHEKEKDDD